MPEYKINSAEYVLLSIWFYTYRYKGIPHTILLSVALAYGMPYTLTHAIMLLIAGIAFFFARLGLKSVRSNMILSQTRDIVNYAKKRQARE